MRKIIVTDHIRQYLDLEYFPETDIEIFTAYSNEEVLVVHRKKNAHLIITELYGSGMNAHQLCSLIREDPQLREVSVMICCRDNEIEISESSRCRANAIMTTPLDPAHLRHKIQQFLSIPSRGDYRLRFSARCARHSLRDPFDCSVRNISVTGMLIEADVDLSEGDRVNCSLVLPPSTSFETQVEVVRRAKSESEKERNQYGVKFSRLDTAARRAIETLVQKNRHDQL